MIFPEQKFNPDTDGKPYERKDPVSLTLRILAASVRLLLSEHPLDFFTWVKSIYFRRKPLTYFLPWLTFGAIHKIHEQCDFRTHPMVFEFGAGHSTIYWARAGARVYAVESDAKWFDLVGDKVRDLGIDNVTMYLKSDKEDYVRCIEKIGIVEFDMVIVDGGPRPLCVEAAIPFVRPGGLLVIDNTDWHWWNKPIRLVPSDWTQIPFKGQVPMNLNRNETTICIRPTGVRQL